MQLLTQEDLEAKLGNFTKEIFIDNAQGDANVISCTVNVTNPEWIMNDHFPGTSIIQCFYQGAQLLFYENDESFDPQESLFFSGGIKVKFLTPIFEGYRIIFNLSCERFTQNILLFEGVCVDSRDRVYAKASGSLSSKKRSEVAIQKARSSNS